jgi:hypothetical protein
MLKGRKAFIIAWGILFIAIGWNFYNVFQLAADIPIEDDWDYLEAVANWDWRTLFAVHVQHRIIFTRLLFYLCHSFNLLDFRFIIILNWFIYLGMVGATALLFRRELCRYPFFALFFLPFFSDAAQTNLLWAGQNQFHFMLLFGLLAVFYGFKPENSKRDTILFCIFLTLSTFSMSPLFPAVILGCNLLKQFMLLHDPANSGQKRNIFLAMIFNAAWGVITAGLFFIHYTPAHLPHPRLQLFVVYVFANLAKSLTLVTSEMPLPLIFIFAILLVLPGLFFLKLLWKLKLRFFRQNGIAVTLLLWGAVFSAAIAWGRNGIMDWRHTEAILPILPATAAILIKYSRRNKKKLALKSFVCLMLLCMCFSFSFKHSKCKCNTRQAGLQKLQHWLRSPNAEPEIPELYPGKGFKDKIRACQKLKLSCLQTDDSQTARRHN